MDKVDHVRRSIAAHNAVTYCPAEIGRFKCGKPAGHEGRHEPAHDCHWPGCGRRVAPASWGCREHWYSLPRALRTRIWQAYRPGQEASKTPSAEYVAVAREVQEWIERRLTDGR